MCCKSHDPNSKMRLSCFHSTRAQTVLDVVLDGAVTPIRACSPKMHRLFSRSTPFVLVLRLVLGAGLREIRLYIEAHWRNTAYDNYCSAVRYYCISILDAFSV